ncbi:hypothetical protein D3C78_1374520 [compost metagenome]
MTCCSSGCLVCIDQRLEAERIAAKYRKCHAKPQLSCQRGAFRCSSDANPYRQAVLERTRRNFCIRKRRTEPSRPCHPFAAIELQQQVQLLIEQLLVILQLIAEQRERLYICSPPDNNLGTAIRHQIQRGEILKYANRIRGA